MIRRYLFHAALAVVASPLPGGVLLAVRLLAIGRGRESLLALAAAGGSGAVLLGLAFFLPFAARPVGWLLMVLSGVSGLGIAWLEHRWGMHPPPPREGSRRFLLRALLWGSAVAVAAIPVAWVIGTMTSRWGPQMLLKPSLQAHILLTAAVWLVPPGIALGLARAFLRRPFRVVAPFAFATALPALFIAFMSVGGISELIKYLWFTPVHQAQTNVFRGDTLFFMETFLTVFFLLALAEYLCDAGGARSFLLRTALITGVLFCSAGFGAVREGTAPVTMRTQAAYRQAARGDEESAAKSWDWVIRRAPKSPEVCSAIEQGALASLRAGDSARARRALEALDEETRRAVPCAARARMADAILPSGMGTGEGGDILVHPVKPESYLDNTWCALLTAVRSVLPDETEIRLKNRLQALSNDPDEIALPRLDGFDDLRVTARLLGTEALAVPSEQIHRLIAAGLPVLFREPYAAAWGLAYADFPEADAILWLDFGQWDRSRERPLTRTEVRRLVGSEQSFETREGEILAEVRRLSSASRLQAALGADGGWVAVLVPRGENGAFEPPAGADTGMGDTLDRIWQSRHAAGDSAYAEAARLAATLPPGPARSELIGLSWLGRESLSHEGVRTGAPDDETRRELAALREGDAVDGMSPWGLKVLLDLAGRVPGLMCDPSTRALERLTDQDPGDGDRLRRLLSLRLERGRPDQIVETAVALARSDLFEVADVVQAIEAIAPLASTEPRSRAELADLLGRLPPIIVSEKEALWPRARSSVAGYCAGRAALAESPATAVAWWRRAVDLDPKKADYRRRLADSLESAGDADSAARARRMADEVTGAAICSGAPVADAGREGS